jgi:hypothetical protein
LKLARPVAACPIDIFFFGRGAARRPRGAPSDEEVYQQAMLNSCEDALSRIRPLLALDARAGRSYIYCPDAVVAAAAAAEEASSAGAEQALRTAVHEHLVGQGLPDVVGPQVPDNYAGWVDGVEPWFSKICTICRFSYPKSCHKCKQLGCKQQFPHLSLPSINEMRKQYGGSDLTMRHRHTNRSVQRRSTGSHLHTVDSPGLLHTQLLLQANSDAAPQHAAHAVSSGPSAPPVRGHFGFCPLLEADTHMFRHVLKSKLANPGINEVKRELLVEAGELLNLQGFARAGVEHTQMRYFAYDLSDQGASLQDREGVFQNWIHIMGHFHEAKMFIECVTGVFRFMGGDALVQVCLTSK